MRIREERLSRGQDRLKSASARLNTLFTQIIDMSRSSDVKEREFAKQLDIDMHDTMGDLAHVHNSLHFLRTDLEKARVYRVIGRVDRWVVVNGGPYSTLEDAKEFLKLVTPSDTITYVIESKIETPWEEVENDASSQNPS